MLSWWPKVSGFLLGRSCSCYRFCLLVLWAYLQDRENWTHPQGLNSHQIVRTIMKRKRKREVKEMRQNFLMIDQVMLPPGIEPGTLFTDVAHHITPQEQTLHRIIQLYYPTPSCMYPHSIGVLPRSSSNSHHSNYISPVFTMQYIYVALNESKRMKYSS